MQGNLHPRTIGACVIGCALVAGAYTLSNFGASRVQPQQASVITSETTPRVAIAVTDNDQNGIEDWRDEFVTAAPIVTVATTTTSYEAPDTLTGELGINFFESYIRSKNYGPFGRTPEEVIDDTVSILTQETAHSLYDTPDITVMSSWEPQDIRTYANTLALAITNSNESEIVEGELFILFDIVTNNATDRLGELEKLSAAYQRMRDLSLTIPVPAPLVKEHLDLINTFHAVHKDIEAMTLAIEDPAFALMRLKRYEDDAAGLGYALENMYRALTPYGSLLQPEDPALLFVFFSPEYKS